MTRPKASRKERREMTAAMRQALARRMHITEDELEDRMLHFELDRLDAATTSIYDLFGDLDPLDPYVRAHELQAAQEYVEEAIYQTDSHAIRRRPSGSTPRWATSSTAISRPTTSCCKVISGNPWSQDSGRRPPRLPLLYSATTPMTPPSGAQTACSSARATSWCSSSQIKTTPTTPRQCSVGDSNATGTTRSTAPTAACSITTGSAPA